MEYSKTHCHFCNKKLNGRNYKECLDDICSVTYGYCAGTNYVKLQINGYKFIISDDGTTKVTEPSPEPVIVKSILNINLDNYLEQVERMKKLQAFK